MKGGRADALGLHAGERERHGSSGGDRGEPEQVTRRVIMLILLRPWPARERGGVVARVEGTGRGKPEWMEGVVLGPLACAREGLGNVATRVEGGDRAGAPGLLAGGCGVAARVEGTGRGEPERVGRAGAPGLHVGGRGDEATRMEGVSRAGAPAGGRGDVAARVEGTGRGKPERVEGVGRASAPGLHAGKRGDVAARVEGPGHAESVGMS